MRCMNCGSGGHKRFGEEQPKAEEQLGNCHCRQLQSRCGCRMITSRLRLPLKATRGRATILHRRVAQRTWAGVGPASRARATWQAIEWRGWLRSITVGLGLQVLISRHIDSTCPRIKSKSKATRAAARQRCSKTCTDSSGLITIRTLNKPSTSTSAQRQFGFKNLPDQSQLFISMQQLHQIYIVFH